MADQAENLHRLWKIAQKRVGESPTQQAVYRLRPNCFLLVNSDGENLTVVVETIRKNVPNSKECFVLYKDGSFELTTWAEVKSGLTERIDTLKMEGGRHSPEELKGTNILGINRMRVQLDELARRLSSRHLKRVDFYNREKIITKVS